MLWLFRQFTFNHSPQSAVCKQHCNSFHFILCDKRLLLFRSQWASLSVYGYKTDKDESIVDHMYIFTPLLVLNDLCLRKRLCKLLMKLYKKIGYKRCRLSLGLGYTSTAWEQLIEKQKQRANGNITSSNIGGVFSTKKVSALCRQ